MSKYDRPQDPPKAKLRILYVTVCPHCTGLLAYGSYILGAHTCPHCNKKINVVY